MWNFIKKVLPKKCLGIDIGTSQVKVVEVYGTGRQKKLENYGQISWSGSPEKNAALPFGQDAGEAIKAIIKEADIKSKQVVFSIPDFLTFFTNLELPSMPKEELSQAIKYEAKRYIPLPVEEVTLDWQMIEGESSGKNIKILLVAVPNEIVRQYSEIAKSSHLDLLSLEAEAFSLSRSLLKESEKGPVALIDVGARSTVCSIVDDKILKISHSLDMAGDVFTSTLAEGLGIDFNEAETLKKQCGIKNNTGEEGGLLVREILTPLLDAALRKIKEILRNFYHQERKNIEKIIITGSASLLPGLDEYFKDSLGKEVEKGNPFSGIAYPPILDKTLAEMGPGFAIAVGSALRGFEY